jgi:hypothetical protein
MNAVPLLLCAALLGWTARAAQFVEVAARIEVINWHYQEETGLPLKNARTHSFRCVVGQDHWLIENLSRTNITESTWLLKGMLVRQINYNYAQSSTADDTGYRSTRRYSRPASMLATPDGYPGSELLVNLPWFTFCSGPYLQQTTRGVPLPTAAPGRTVFGYTNETTLFADAFGLPRRAVFYEMPRQIKGRYDVQQSTNVLGWNFPLAFTAEEHEPDRFGKWSRALTVNGRVTSIRAVPKLEVPEDILERIENPDPSPARRRP